jgi:hypothetical protein
MHLHLRQQEEGCRETNWLITKKSQERNPGYQRQLESQTFQESYAALNIFEDCSRFEL